MEKKKLCDFIDGCRKHCYIYLLHNKYETLDKLKEFKFDVANQLK